MSLFKELKRKNVIRIAGIYAVVAWILMQVAGTLEDSLNLPQCMPITVSYDSKLASLRGRNDRGNLL